MSPRVLGGVLAAMHRPVRQDRAVMTVDSPPPDLAGIVARLRAAGCVFAEDEAALLVEAAGTPSGLAAMVDRRVAGHPLEQVVGWAEFAGLRILLEPGVFVPRRRTELLVHEAAAAAAPGALVVDLCCGSGAIGAALLATGDQIELHAVDVDPAAVRCAGRNLAAAGGGQVYAGDLYTALPTTLQGRVDVVVANVPYVPTEAIDTLPPEARQHEPPLALDGGPDGLDVLRRVTAGAGEWLAPGGRLFVETSSGQVDRAVDAFERGGLLTRVARSAELGATVISGRRPGP
jgi:release factor glutamine methyltransferase